MNRSKKEGEKEREREREREKEIVREFGGKELILQKKTYHSTNYSCFILLFFCCIIRNEKILEIIMNEQVGELKRMTLAEVKTSKCPRALLFLKQSI